MAEAKARERLLASNLPRPMWNPTLRDAATGRFIAVPDGWFDEVGLAWELDFHEWHLDPEDHAQTLARRAAMTAEGIIVVPHTPGRVVHDWPAVCDEIERGLGQAARRPRPDVIATPAPDSNPTSGTFVG